MKALELIESILKAKGMKKTELANAAGINPQLVNYRLKRVVNMTIPSMVQLLDACGYRLVAMPKTEKIKDGWYEVD